MNKKDEKFLSHAIQEEAKGRVEGWEPFYLIRSLVGCRLPLAHFLILNVSGVKPKVGFQQNFQGRYELMENYLQLGKQFKPTLKKSL